MAMKKATKKSASRKSTKKATKKSTKKTAKKTGRRTSMRSKSGNKLYALRGPGGEFKDVQTYKRAHGSDVQRDAANEN
jgi:hypothetical protein